jgi:hypothetical protein
MKSPQKITRVQLDINEQDELFIFGIVSADPDYKLSLKLNKKLHIFLRNTSPIEFQDDSGNELIFSRFSDISRVPDSVFNLISNRSGINFLLKKLKNIDYILQLHDPGNNYDLGQLSARLKEIDTVTAVFKLDFKTLKDKNLGYLAH